MTTPLIINNHNLVSGKTFLIYACVDGKSVFSVDVDGKILINEKPVENMQTPEIEKSMVELVSLLNNKTKRNLEDCTTNDQQKT